MAFPAFAVPLTFVAACRLVRLFACVAAARVAVSFGSIQLAASLRTIVCAREETKAAPIAVIGIDEVDSRALFRGHPLPSGRVASPGIVAYAPFKGPECLLSLPARDRWP
jgi:hypothetical protein